VVGARAGNVIEQILCEVAMGINQSDPMPQGDVLDNHVAQKGRLSRTGFPDDVNMLAEIRQGNSKGDRLPPFLTYANLDAVMVHGC